MNIDIIHPYVKFRETFGRQPIFSEVPPHMLDSIAADPTIQKQYCLRNPVNHEVQVSLSQSEHEINTKVIKFKDGGINHAEGGWLKDVHFADEELTTRYRRRIERDDDYINAIFNMSPQLIHYVDQNNAVEMYNVYFKEMPSINPVEKSTIRINNVYRDPNGREIGCLSWTHEDNAKLLVTYCAKNFPIVPHKLKNTTGYVWDLEINTAPVDEFIPPSKCWQIVGAPIHPSVLVGGLEDGRVCIFDLRAKKEPTALNPLHLAHRDSVTSVAYMFSRQNTDFFSGSTDGQCMWWDIRNLSSPTTQMIISPLAPLQKNIVNLSNANPVSCLQYERSFPAKFLCGTDTGYAVSVNRKGKSHSEMMSAVYCAHNGPVRTLSRNPYISKMFVSCGDFTAHIWNEDLNISPIVTGLAHKYPINDIAWAPHRVSGYMSVCADGKLRYWDLLRKYRGPVIVFSVSKWPLLKICPHEEGHLIAVGDKKGEVYIICISDNLVHSDEKDKSLMTQMFERETRRERILENRVKEIRLKLHSEGVATVPEDSVDRVGELQLTEEEYRRIVQEEIQRAGITQIKSTPAEMRTR